MTTLRANNISRASNEQMEKSYTWTDAQTWSAVVATTAETTLGNVSVPAGETWLITDIWCGGRGGFFRLDITGTNAIGDFVGKFLQQDVAMSTLTETGLAPYKTDILVEGACTLTVYVTNRDSTGATSRAMIIYRRYES